ncbi:MAG: hypothetical protein HC929_21335, partial [Leptolyngbyaceae cyanobacterium SM2_5_2]|nr:hypothetical protein [Leptolyngbyaceae cyanobacterium SM2_5_2]
MRASIAPSGGGDAVYWRLQGYPGSLGGAGRYRPEYSYRGGNPPAETLPVFFLEYDYEVQASTTQAGADLSTGSKLLVFIANGSGAAVENRTVRSGLTL